MFNDCRNRYIWVICLARGTLNETMSSLPARGKVVGVVCSAESETTEADDNLPPLTT